MDLEKRFIEIMNIWQRQNNFPLFLENQLDASSKDYINRNIRWFLNNMTLEDIMKYCDKARTRELYGFLLEKGMDPTTGILKREDVCSIVETYQDNDKIRRQALVLHYMERGEIYDTLILSDEDLKYVEKHRKRIMKAGPKKSTWFLEDYD